MPKEPEIYLVGDLEVEVQFLSKTKALVDKQEVVGADRQQLLLEIGNKLRNEYQVSTMAIMGLYDVVDLH